MIAGRTAALATLGLEETIERVKILASTGVDAIFITGITTIEQVEAFHAVTSLPIISGSGPMPLDKMGELGVRVVIERHTPYFVMLQALYECYEHIVAGKPVSELGSKALSKEIEGVVLDNAEYSEDCEGVPRG